MKGYQFTNPFQYITRIICITGKISEINGKDLEYLFKFDGSGYYGENTENLNGDFISFHEIDESSFNGTHAIVFNVSHFDYGMIKWIKKDILDKLSYCMASDLNDMSVSLDGQVLKLDFCPQVLGYL